MQRLILLLFVALFSYDAYNQGFSFSLGTGLGTCQMKDLKDFQNMQLVNLPVAAKVVNNFPAFPLYNFKMIFSKKRFEVGNSYTFVSSGSKIHYADYSGELSLIQIVNSHQVGIMFNPVFITTDKYKILGLVKSSILFNGCALKQNIRVFDQTGSDRLDLSSHSFSFSFGLSYCKKINFVEIRSEVEYFFDTGGELYLKGIKDAKLTDLYGDPIKTDWSGFRIGISIGFYKGLIKK